MSSLFPLPAQNQPRMQRVREGLDTALEPEAPISLGEGPARLYAIPGSAGKVGVISTLSADGCGRCTRVRLTSRGELKPCLSGGPPLDLLDPLRHQASHEDLVRPIHEALLARRECHPMGHGEQRQLPRHKWRAGG